MNGLVKCAEKVRAKICKKICLESHEFQTMCGDATRRSFDELILFAIISEIIIKIVNVPEIVIFNLFN